MSTRGAHSWVRKTPTGLPDWTSIVSSSPRVRSVRAQRVERVPRTGRPAGPAVDHEIVGPLGHLGVEVVVQHPVGGLLWPAAARELAARVGADSSRAGTHVLTVSRGVVAEDPEGGCSVGTGRGEPGLVR